MKWNRSQAHSTLTGPSHKCLVCFTLNYLLKLAADGAVRSGTCQFPAECMWQTCWVGDDSCFWTVNCPANDDECDDMIHNSDFHVNDDPITCKACFNTACKGCDTAWESCSTGGGIGHGVGECENGDVEEGWDCGMDSDSIIICRQFCPGRKRCPWPSNEKFADAVFDCPQDRFEDGYVLSGNMCYLTCGNSRPGGAVVCKDDGTWDDSEMFCKE